MTYVDEDASNGVHKYYVVPVNAAGRGVPRNIDAFVGRDVPGPVMNVVATTTMVSRYSSVGIYPNVATTTAGTTHRISATPSHECPTRLKSVL